MPALTDKIELDKPVNEYPAFTNHEFITGLDSDMDNDEHDDEAAVSDDSRLLTSTPMRRKPEFIASYSLPAVTTSNEMINMNKYPASPVSDAHSRPIYQTKYLKRQEPQPETRPIDRLSPIPVARSDSLSPAMPSRHNLSTDRARIQALAQQNPLFNESSAHFSHRQRHSISAEPPRPIYTGFHSSGGTERKGSRLGSVHSRSSSLASSSRLESPSNTSINSSLFRSFSPDVSDDVISPLARQLSSRPRSRLPVPPLLSPAASPVIEREPATAKDLSESSISFESNLSSESIVSPEQTERQLEIVEMDIQQTRRTYEKLKERLDLQVKLRESLAGRANATLNQNEIVEDLEKSGPKTENAEKGSSEPFERAQKPENKATAEISRPIRFNLSKQRISSRGSKPTGSTQFSFRHAFLYTCRTAVLLLLVYALLNFVDYYLCLQEANRYRAAGYSGSLNFNGKLWPPPLDRLFEDPD